MLVPMNTFVDASLTAGRKTGQIKLHGPEAFAGMRSAGRLTAEALDLLVDKVVPGVTPAELDRLIFDFAMDHRAYPATARLSRLPQVDLHVHQSRRLSRHSR